MSSRPPSLSARQIIRVLEARGFVLSRQSGSHAIFRHPDGRGTTVPVHGKRDLGRGLLKTHPIGSKGFTKAGIRKMIARLHEELGVYEGSEEARRPEPD